MVPRHGAECRYSHAENASIAHIQSRAYDQKIDAGPNDSEGRGSRVKRKSRPLK
jgi:hypothetical protein